MKWMKIFGATALALGLASCEKIEKKELTKEEKETSVNSVAKAIPKGTLIQWKDFMMHCSSSNSNAEKNFNHYKKVKFTNWRGKCVNILESMTVKNSRWHSPHVIELLMTPTGGGSSDLRARFADKYKPQLAKIFSGYENNPDALPKELIFSGEIRFIGGAMSDPIVYVESFAFPEVGRNAYESEKIRMDATSLESFLTTRKTLITALEEEPNPDKKVAQISHAKKIALWKALGHGYLKLKYREEQKAARDKVQGIYLRPFHNLNIKEMIAWAEKTQASDPEFYVAKNFKKKPKKADEEK